MSTLIFRRFTPKDCWQIKTPHRPEGKLTVYEQQQEEQFYNHAINISTLWIQQKGQTFKHMALTVNIFLQANIFLKSWPKVDTFPTPKGIKRSVVPHCTCCLHHKQVVYWLSWCTISGILFLKEVPMNHDMPELVKHQWIHMKHKPWRPTNH